MTAPMAPQFTVSRHYEITDDFYYANLMLL